MASTEDGKKIDPAFLSPYTPSENEEVIYNKWEEEGMFNPEECEKKGVAKSDRPPFSIIMPPPNVTGALHMGSALMLAVEDMMVRFQRMKGRKTLWIPGTDHASIATESKVEKSLQKRKIKRSELTREEFLEEIDEFVQESKRNIRDQIKKMGASVDWSREAFTLDRQREKAVKTAFSQLYKQGLIKRGEQIVNWDPKGQTAISDDEVEYQEGKALLYTFKYSSDFPISIATTRPETKVGDTAVAVNPEDKRYQKYIGKEYKVNFAGCPLNIKIVGDKEVDPEFGTGALGVTPAHSKTDWDIAQKNHLPWFKIINEYARMEVENPDINGLKTTDAREYIVRWLKEEELLEREEEIEQNISVSYRSGGVIEPIPKLQWFIDVNKKFNLPHSSIPGIKAGQKVSLKELMLHVVKEGHIKIIPERFNKIYYHWVENLHDWCISRQICYGHRIPVWYKENKDSETEIHVGEETPKGEGWEQDPDTLDTWFSSGLWTFSTLGWPDNVETSDNGPEIKKRGDLEEYHPTSILETGEDIIFFWVARMILMSTSLLGEVPFKTVYLHGMVRDEKGQKLSKSLGNNLDPREASKQYGSDAVRMSLVIGTRPGNDSKISPQKLKAYKHFANKIWNASRFVFENTSDENESEPESMPEKYQEYHKEFEDLKKEITKDMENYRLYLAGEKLYHYFWHRFADVIIEDAKKDISESDDVTKESARYTLFRLLRTSLVMLHPFMPFITETVWQKSPYLSDRPLMAEEWPNVDN
ncbi:MAG: valine--tRNA ligase [Patescibacteria group bacterium]